MEKQELKPKKTPKRGIVYLSTIPPYMNVSRIREYFGQFGDVGRVYLQLETEDDNEQKKKKNKHVKHFSEGWIEFEKKSVAKKVAMLLNNTQISNRKKSKQFDYLWNIKFLKNFKWTHLNERLAYEKAVRRQKLRTEISQAKRQANFFTSNIEKSSKKKTSQNKIILQNESSNKMELKNENESDVDREIFLKDLFS